MFAILGVENTQNRYFMLKSPFSGIFAHFHEKRLFGKKSKATHKLGQILAKSGVCECFVQSNYMENIFVGVGSRLIRPGFREN